MVASDPTPHSDGWHFFNEDMSVILDIYKVDSELFALLKIFQSFLFIES